MPRNRNGNQTAKWEDARTTSREKHEKSCKISVDRLMNMVIQSAKAESGKRQQQQHSPEVKARAPIRCTMFKVPEPIRRVSRDSYNPRLISFGLYNRFDDRWASMDRVKQEVASTVLRVLIDVREKKDVEFKALDEKEKTNLIWDNLCANVLCTAGRDTVSSNQYGDYIWKLYDNPTEDLTLPVVKHVLLLDAIFLVSFLVFLQTDPDSKSILLRGFQNYKPLLPIFTRAGMLCNLNIIAGDMWLFENQIPLSLIRKMVRHMYLDENINVQNSTPKLGAERAFESLVRESVIRVMRVLSVGYTNEPNRDHEESKMDRLFKSINLRRCNHLLECLYRMVCSQDEQQLQLKKNGKKKSPTSDSQDMVSTSDNKGVGNQFRSHSRRFRTSLVRLGNALVQQHSIFNFSTSEADSNISLRSILFRLSPFSSFKDHHNMVESFQAPDVAETVDAFSFLSHPEERISSATVNSPHHFLTSKGAQLHQDFSKHQIQPDSRSNEDEPGPEPLIRWSSGDSKTQEQITVLREEVAFPAERDMSKSDSEVLQAGIYEINNLHVHQREETLEHIPADELLQSSASDSSITPHQEQSQRQQLTSAETGYTTTTFDAGLENRTISREGMSFRDLIEHGFVQPVLEASSLSTQSAQSSSFRNISNRSPATRSSRRIMYTPRDTTIDMNSYTLPTLSNLREVGIEVKGDSHPGCKVELGRSLWPWGSSSLHISPLNVDGNTERFLRNLVAFEIVTTSEHKLLTYLQCLDDLINDEEDVRQLKGGKNPVILNCTMNERDVARMFNRMLLNCTVYHNEELQEIRRKVRSYYLQQWRRSLTEFRDRYCTCSKPWVVLSLMVGFTILSFSALQTTYTVLGSYN